MKYAVTWRVVGEEPVYAGSLEIRGTSLSLVGTAPSIRDFSTSVSLGEVTDVLMERVHKGRLRGRPTLVLGRRNGADLQIASLSGAGFLNEIEGRVLEARRLARAVTPGEAATRAAERPPVATAGAGVAEKAQHALLEDEISDLR